MKKQLLTLGILIIAFLNGFGQEIYTPVEIFEIMEKSIISYELNILEKEIPPKDRSGNLNYNHYYRVIDEGVISTYDYEIDSNAISYLTQAEEYFLTNRISLARDMYLEVLRVDSSYFQVMTYIGQTYGIEGDFENAIEWYNKAISLNYIDYMAHWFLADAYIKQGNIDKAVDEITIAMILNRNNPRIKKSFNDIYELKKFKKADWSFNPQMEIDSIGINKVSISMDINWLGYAVVKALWKYEPGYKESKGVSEGSFSTIEEKEGFVSLMTSFDKKKLKKHPEFRALKLALDKNMIDEFILYEIVLPDYPFVAYQFSEELIISIKNYVKEIRGNQK